MAKKKKPQINTEQMVKTNLDHNFKRLHDKKELFLNPTRKYTVGQKVEAMRANWHDCVVAEVYEDIFYLINYKTTTKIQYRDEYITTDHSTWKAWNELTTEESRQTVNFNKRRENMMFNMSFSNRELSDLISKYYYFGVDMDPAYQRGHVWSAKDKVALIDSIFEGVEIGKFSFIHRSFEVDKPGYEILDGKQRMTAIIEFMQDRFPFKGKYYSQLSEEDIRYFEGFMVTVGESRDELTLEHKMRYFLRLNVGGVAQSEEHLNKVRDMLNKEVSNG